MYSSLGLTFGDLKRKIAEISKYVSDDTDLHITFNGFDTDYVVNKIVVVGSDYPNKDEDDRIMGCPIGIEFISEEVIEQSDVYDALASLGSDAEDFCIEYMEKNGGIDKVLERYGDPRW